MSGTQVDHTEHDVRADPGPRVASTATEHPPRRRLVALLVVGLIAARLVAIVVLLGSGLDRAESILGGDARRYQAITHGWGTPYEDYEVEYPPLALGFMHLIDSDDTFTMQVRLVFSQLALELGVAGLLAWAWGRRTAVAYLVLGTPMIFFPFPYARLDLLSVFLAVLALALYRRHRDVAGGALLGIAAFAKIWPVALGPVFAVERRFRALTAWVVAGAIGAAMWLAWVGISGVEQVVTLRGSKGWQIESVVGLLVHMLDPGNNHVEGGAWRTIAAVPGPLKVALPFIAIGFVSLTWVLAARRHAADRAANDPDLDDLVLYAWAPLGALLSLLVFATIISPQYLLWLVPFAAIAVARGDRVVGVLFLAIAVLTTYGLGAIRPLVRGELWVTLPVLLRNGLLIVLLVVCIQRLRDAKWSWTTASPSA